MSSHSELIVQNDKTKKTNIEHIVISGGGVYGFTFYGILKELHKLGIWNISNIKTFYATSIGSIISTIIALNYEWEIMDRYLIHRPLEELFEIDLATILNCVNNCGFFTIKLIEDMFYNLFTGKDMSPLITMKEFYEITGIEMHFFTTKVDGFEMIDVSYKTHPTWTMVEAMFASSSIFPVLTPLFKDGERYCDGGFLMNYPLNKCLSDRIEIDPAFDKNTVLGIKYNGFFTKEKKINKIVHIDNKEKNSTCVSMISNFISNVNEKTDYSLFRYLQEIVANMLNNISVEKNKNVENIENIIEVSGDLIFFLDLSGFTDLENRKKLIEHGVKLVKIFKNK